MVSPGANEPIAFWRGYDKKHDFFNIPIVLIRNTKFSVSCVQILILSRLLSYNKKKKKNFNLEYF